MGIGDKDREFMNEISAYFKSTKTDDNPVGSIRDTALKFGISCNKIRKTLITTGDIKSEITDKAVAYQRMGMSIKKIAEKLGVSSATVSVYLPYTDRIRNGLDPSDHAKAVREYRDYERKLSERQVQKSDGDDGSWKDEWKKEIALSYKKTDTKPQRVSWKDAPAGNMMDAYKGVSPIWDSYVKQRKKREEQDSKEFDELSFKEMNDSLSKKEKERLDELIKSRGLYPGALVDRRIEDLEKMSRDKIPVEPFGVVRLHLELQDELNAKDRETLKRYGNVKYGDHISRDVIVPEDIPLYAIHYMIQRLFGWQNSHLHRFELPDELFKSFTENNTVIWSELVGIMFRSPFMDEGDEFWADDYKRGSFKNWLTKKYTGPYLSQCHGEGLIACRDSMRDFRKQIKTGSKYYVTYIRHGEEERPFHAVPAVNRFGLKRDKAGLAFDQSEEVRTMELADVPLESLWFERGPKDLLERLPLSFVLNNDPEMISGREMILMCKRMADHIVENDIDTPMVQAYPVPITDTIDYYYDFGDDWKIRITVMNDCKDLVKEGRITQEQIDKAQIKCRELYRPVTLAVDGEMLMDDVGGVGGFIDFLETINMEFDGLDEYERKKTKQEKKETLSWANNVQNWKKLGPII